MEANPADILKTVMQIRNHKHQGKQALMQTYQSFYETYPALFNACLDPSFKMDQLAYMLKQRDRIKNEGLSIDQADKEVYGVLKEKYVYPVLDEAGIPYDEPAASTSST